MIDRTPVSGIALPGDGILDISSLAQQAAKAETKLQLCVDIDGDLEPIKLYQLLFERHLGRKKVSVHPREKLTLLRVQRYCESQGIDFPLYISANMRAVRGRWAAVKHGFSASWLQGDSARARYNAEVRRMGRRLHHAESDGVETADSALQDLLHRAEYAVGEWMVSAALNGETVSEEQAGLITVAPPQWWGMYHPSRDMKHSMTVADVRGRHGKKWLELFIVSIRLGAAAAIADTCQYGLSEQVGYREPFSWAGLAQLVASIMEVKRVQVPERLQASQWRAGHLTADCK